MRRATALHLAGSWNPAAEIGQVTLAASERHRRRVALADDLGEGFLLDLAKAAQMKDGDGLELDCGGFIRVVAAPEEVIDIACRSGAELARIAWHMGNRHMPIQILPDQTLRIAVDHVAMTMLEGLGASVRRQRAPFQPESGAYDPHGLAEMPAPKVKWA